MKNLKVYIAGKVSKNSVFGTHDWRDGFCVELSKQLGVDVVNFDPTKSSKSFDLDQNNSSLVVGRNSFMMKRADLIIVNLTDDISVGGSQEMLIAKYLQKPLIGLAPRGGKFNREEKEFFGRVFTNYIDPYVAITCDRIAQNMEDLVRVIPELLGAVPRETKNIAILEETLQYYEKNYYSQDDYVQSLNEESL